MFWIITLLNDDFSFCTNKNNTYYVQYRMSSLAWDIAVYEDCNATWQMRTLGNYIYYHFAYVLDFSIGKFDKARSSRLF